MHGNCSTNQRLGNGRNSVEHEQKSSSDQERPIHHPSISNRISHLSTNVWTLLNQSEARKWWEFSKAQVLELMQIHPKERLHQVIFNASWFNAINVEYWLQHGPYCYLHHRTVQEGTLTLAAAITFVLVRKRRDYVYGKSQYEVLKKAI